MKGEAPKGIGKRHDSEPATSKAPAISTPRASGGIPVVTRDENLGYKRFDGAKSTIQNSEKF